MKKALFLLSILVIALFIQSISEYQLFSLFEASISIPFLIMLATPPPIALVVCAFFILELFSSLPQGSMLLMFFIPYIALLFWKNSAIELSWKSFFAVAGIVTLQHIALLCMLAIMNSKRAFEIPWHITLLQIIVTSAATFILAFIYREYSRYIKP